MAQRVAPLENDFPTPLSRTTNQEFISQALVDDKRGL